MTFLKHKFSESNVTNCDRTTILCYRAMHATDDLDTKISESCLDFERANAAAGEIIFKLAFYGGAE